MRNTGQIIKMLREERRISQAKLASDLKISQSSVAMYEKCERMPKPEILESIADYFNVDMNFLYGKTHIRNSTREIPDSSDLTKYKNVIPIPPMKRVPIIGEIACGEPIYRPGDYGELAEIPEGVDADFALRANGDSMTGARIYDGDLVFCRATDIVDNGRIAAVSIDDEATLKRFYLYEDKGLLILKPENPDYEDLIYTGDELNSVRVLGQAVAFQSLIK